ncbi:MAG: ribosome silencing factor [bacterium]
MKKVRAALEAKKGEDIAILDVQSLSNVTDYYVIATGNNGPHLKALAAEVEHVMEAEGRRCFRRAGAAESQWIVVDYIDFVVHIFSHDTREFYGLERLWNDAVRVQ